MKPVFSKNAPRGHYSPGMISGGTLYISGQTSLDPATGEPAEGGVKGQTMMALQKLEAVLDAAGLTKEAVVHCKVYMTKMSMWEEVNEAYQQFFGDHKPARIALPVTELNKGCLIEVEAVAEVND